MEKRDPNLNPPKPKKRGGLISDMFTKDDHESNHNSIKNSQKDRYAYNGRGSGPAMDKLREDMKNGLYNVNGSNKNKYTLPSIDLPNETYDDSKIRLSNPRYNYTGIKKTFR